jgi:hypothetical protein
MQEAAPGDAPTPPGRRDAQRRVGELSTQRRLLCSFASWAKWTEAQVRLRHVTTEHEARQQRLTHLLASLQSRGQPADPAAPLPSSPLQTHAGRPTPAETRPPRPSTPPTPPTPPAPPQQQHRWPFGPDTTALAELAARGAPSQLAAPACVPPTQFTAEALTPAAPGEHGDAERCDEEITPPLASSRRDDGAPPPRSGERPWSSAHDRIHLRAEERREKRRQLQERYRLGHASVQAAQDEQAGALAQQQVQERRERAAALRAAKAAKAASEQQRAYHAASSIA